MTLNGVMTVILRYYAVCVTLESELHVKLLSVSRTTLSATKM